MAMTAEEGGEGEEFEPGFEPGPEELLAVSRSEATSSWPSPFDKLFLEFNELGEPFPVPTLPAGTKLVLSSSISRICSCRISSFESGIKYLRT